jgi:hypothetical protein
MPCGSRIDEYRTNENQCGQKSPKKISALHFIGISAANAGDSTRFIGYA